MGASNTDRGLTLNMERPMSLAEELCTSRRGFLVAAAPAIMAAGIVSTGLPAQAARNDTDLVSLGQRFDEIHAQHDSASAEENRLFALVEEKLPERPGSLRRRPSDWDLFFGMAAGDKFYSAEDVIWLRSFRGFDSSNASQRSKACARAREIVAAFDTWLGEVNRVEAEVGLPEKMRLVGRLYEQREKVVEAIESARIASFAGVAVKARVAASMRDQALALKVAEEIAALHTTEVRHG
jgi:hypothetical protein